MKKNSINVSRLPEGMYRCVRDERYDYPVNGDISAICQNCKNDYPDGEGGNCFNGNRINGCMEYTPVD